MNVIIMRYYRQVSVLLALLVLASCGIKKTENAIIPPATSPLSRSVIGYGIVNISYTQLKTDPDVQGSSHAYMRRGTVVSILERRVIHNGNRMEKWVLVDGQDQGWIKEELVDIYDNELQARTAAESML